MKEASVILQFHGDQLFNPGEGLTVWASYAISAGMIIDNVCEPADFQDLITTSLNEAAILNYIESWDYTFLDSSMIHVSCYYNTDENFVELSQYIREKTGLKLESAKDDTVELIVILD